MEERTCKVVLVGDSRCGKTALIYRFTNDHFVSVYTPTGFERYTADYEVLDYRVHFTIWDTSVSPSGKEHLLFPKLIVEDRALAYDTVRPLAYQDAKVFLLCFHMAVPASLDNAVNKWYREIRQHSPATPIILCGCANDLKSDSNIISDLSYQKKSPVAVEQAVSAARSIGAVTYVETSSKQCGKTVHDAFEIAALAAMGKLNKSRHALMTLTKCKKPKKHKGNKNNKALLKEEIRVKAGYCTII